MRRDREDTDEGLFLQGGDAEDDGGFFTQRKGIRELVAPEGFCREEPEYAVLIDGGKKVYVMCLYVHKLPQRTMFATTFAALFNFPGVASSVFISPLGETKSQQIVDKRVRSLDVELGDAQDSGDTNRIRKMQAKFEKAQMWASRIESGDNSLYAVQFLFSAMSDSREGLYKLVADFRMRALQSQIELVSCYALQTEAFFSTLPLNRAQKFRNADFIKTHVFDRHALGDVFNHTTCSFLHPNGVYLGHYLHSMQAFLYDPFDRSHDGFGAIFAGGTGTGKSATIKMLQSRLADFGVRFRTLDIESRTSHGEYTLTALAAGGINFDIRANGENRLNPFDINAEMEFDESTGAEYPVLRLAEKRAYLVDLFLSMVKMGSREVSATLDKAMASILADMVCELYMQRGIRDGEPESLYSEDGGGFLGSGRSKKAMPVLADAFRWLLQGRKQNDNRLHDEAYQVLIDTMREQVREVYYGKETLRFFTREEYESLEEGQNGRRYARFGEDGKKREPVLCVTGSRSYFDGQSTVHADFDTPYVNYDISRVPEADRKFAILVLLGYMEENDIKPNSANPLRMSPLIVLTDELHVLFPYPEARRCIERFFRTARKRWVGPWVSTQSLADFGNEERYPELAGVYKNTDTYFLFRHSTADREYFHNNTDLTESQVERIFSLGVDPTDPDLTDEEKKRRTGEICVVDRKRVAFVKVDYLEGTEADFVETNAELIRRKHKREGSR